MFCRVRREHAIKKSFGFAHNSLEGEETGWDGVGEEGGEGGGI